MSTKIENIIRTFLTVPVLTISLNASAAQITTLKVTGGEFHMGVFTPTGSVPFSYTDSALDLIATFPTTVGWDVGVKQTTAGTGSVVAFNFGDPVVNTFIVPCDSQVADGCDVTPHTSVTGTVNGGSPTIADGDPIIVDINGLYANWNGINFNQGGTTGSGVAYPTQSFAFSFDSTVSNVVGNTFDYDMTWQSLIVGGPFNGQTGTWRFIGTGTVALVGNLPQTDAGLTLASDSIGSIAGLTLSDLSNTGYPLPGTDQDCIGGCWDWKLSGLSSAGDSANVVIPLGSGILTPGSADQSIAVWKLNTSTMEWSPFEVGGGDSIRTAPINGLVCPAPGDTAYTDGLTPGNSCLQLTVTDGGSNDADGLANQEIIDPGSVVLLTNPKGITQINEGGCALVMHSRSGVFSGGEWVLLVGFIGWLGLRSSRA